MKYTNTRRVRRAHQRRSLDEAKRNPGLLLNRKHIPDYASLHPGYILMRHCERLNRMERLRTAEGWPKGRNPWMGEVTAAIP